MKRIYNQPVSMVETLASQAVLMASPTPPPTAPSIKIGSGTTTYGD